MKVVQIQFAPWDKVYNFNPTDHALMIGDQVVVKTELGTELGRIVGFIEVSQTEAENVIKPLVRKATTTDMEKVPNEKQKKKDLEYCKKNIIKYDLPMKLVDVHYSFDGSRITFAFIADGRIDFRELVKELTRYLTALSDCSKLALEMKLKLWATTGIAVGLYAAADF